MIFPFLMSLFCGISVMAQDCTLLEKQILCLAPMPVSDKNLQHVEQLAQKIPMDLESQKLGCELGLDKNKKSLETLVKWETSKMAPWLQKIQALKESRKLNGQQNFSDLEKFERLIRKSSLLEYAPSSNTLSQQIQSELIWQPRQVRPDIKRSMSAAYQDLDNSKFPKSLTEEISRAKNAPASCEEHLPTVKLLKESAKTDSPRTYHFKKILLADYSADTIRAAFKACPAKSKSKACQTSIDDQIKHLEAEYDTQLCVFHQLSPEIGGQLGRTSLEIPSVMGDLVTEGPGDRPTEAEAKSAKFKLNVACPEDFTVGGLLRMVGGAGASFLTHELSHETVARIQGEKLDWNYSNGTWRSTTTPDKHRVIAMAGLASHNVSSEVIVQNNNQDSQFQKGWLFWNIFNTTNYFIKDWRAKSGSKISSHWGSGTSDSRGAGDLKAFSKSESYILGTLMIGHQLYSGYRYLQNRQNYQCKKQW